jgi:hypothetical protein
MGRCILVYITGDIHGDLGRFKQKPLRKLRKNDYLIVCGDFGFLWDGSEAEQKLLKWIGKRRYHVLFVEGSHDNYSLLLKYPKTPWNGGEVRRISGKLLHLCRGGVFEIDGHSVFAFGGGESEDTSSRADQGNWWKEELPEPWEIDDARRNLEAVGNEVEFIITHRSSLRTKTFLNLDGGEANVLDVFFDEVRQKIRFQKWFFGSFHIDKLIPPGEVALFQSFAEMKRDATLINPRRKRAK